VVSEGAYTYRQRDLDAFMLIATRHARQKLSQGDEDQLRQALIQALPARESLLAALAGLPPVLAGKARDQLVLDLLDYQAERAPIKPLTPASPAARDEADEAASAAADTGPVLVRLPNLTMNRVLDGVGKRQLVLGIALYFADAGLSKKLENRAPLVQDAILGHLNALPDRDFAEPNQLTLKEGLIAAVKTKVPEFPADGILIPQLEVTAPDAPAPAPR
jgi:flagellar basal body-associated protein FliL